MPMNPAEHKQAMLRLVQSATLSERELQVLYERATDPSYWRQRHPHLSIDAQGAREAIEARPLDEPEIRAQAEQLRTEGYFHTRPVVSPAMVDRLRSCVESLRADGWPLAFSFVFDEFWQIVRSPSLTAIVRAFLGESYLQNSLVWTYYVAPMKGAKGWPPHSDSRGQSRLTVWTPLTEANLLNGCMCVLPMDRVPGTLPPSYRDIESVTADELSQLMQSVKPLPAIPGAWLGWHHQLIHWGSMSTDDAQAPRISIAVEFVASTAEPRDQERPLIHALQLPSFEDRLKMVGKAILTYRRFEPLMNRFEPLALLLTSQRPN